MRKECPNCGKICEYEWKIQCPFCNYNEIQQDTRSVLERIAESLERINDKIIG